MLIVYLYLYYLKSNKGVGLCAKAKFRDVPGRQLLLDVLLYAFFYPVNFYFYITNYSFYITSAEKIFTPAVRNHQVTVVRIDCV